MITFMILAVIAIIIAAVLLAVLGTIGIGVLAVFGDLAVFGLIIYAIILIARFFKRKK